MLPLQFNYGPKKKPGELRHVQDFDLPYAYQSLGKERVSSERSEWRTPLWINFLFGTLTLVIGFGFWLAFKHELHKNDEISTGAWIVFGIFAFVLAGAAILFAVGSVARGRLILDRKNRVLIFYRFWFSIRAHHRLKLSNISHVTQREYFSASADEDSPGHTYQILVAELNDGRSASIAIDFPLSLKVELQRALKEPAPGVGERVLT